jgi:hypothetical protein
MLTFPGIPPATEITAGSSPSSLSATPSGGGFSAALDALNTVQNLPGFNLAYQAASPGALGGPAGMIGAAAFSALSNAVQGGAARAGAAPGSGAIAGAGTIASDQVTGLGDLASRSFAALAAYDRTSGATAPTGRILA